MYINNPKKRGNVDMPTLSEARISALLAPYLRGIVTPDSPYLKLSLYLDLLLKWNSRTNLTAIRDPEIIVQRHFGESLFAGAQLSTRLGHGASLLDFGSGAGFPGVPIQLLRTDLRVMLAESQGKKAAFLGEVVRTLGLTTEVWGRRVEDLPQERSFDAVTLRAVDNMEQALTNARRRVARGGWLVTLSTQTLAKSESIPMPSESAGFVNLLRKL